MGRKTHSPTWKKTFQIARPSKGKKGRKLYAIQEVSFDEDGKRKIKTLDREEIDAINKQLSAGKPRHECEILVQEVLANVRAAYRKQFGKTVHCSENLDLLERYWDRHYKNRDISAPEVMRWELERAVETVGHLSLLSASEEQLQTALNEKWKGNKQRRMASRLNTLLDFAGRDIALKHARKVAPKVRHLSAEQLQKVLPHLPNAAFQTLARVAFGTGARAGEIFGLEPENWNGKTILQILDQERRRGAGRGETKTRRIRKSYVTKHGREALKEWFAIPVEQRLAMRDEDHADILATACRAEFPNDPSKHLVFHDLRHSYAIHMLRNGVSLTLVAQSLGNSVSVCQEYYAGYSLSDETISAISEMMGDKDADPKAEAKAE